MITDISLFVCSGSLVLTVSQTEEKDMLWIVDPDLFPFKQTLVESHVSYCIHVGEIFAWCKILQFL